MLAPNTAQSLGVIGKYPFGAWHVFVSDGTAYCTSLQGGSAGQQYYWAIGAMATLLLFLPWIKDTC